MMLFLTIVLSLAVHLKFLASQVRRTLLRIFYFLGIVVGGPFQDFSVTPSLFCSDRSPKKEYERLLGGL